eukprot:XP_003967783.1 PREDICTED: unconventional myosin-Va-like [Takifugu rubripes]
MLSPEHYTKHVPVWLPDEAEVWKSAELIRDYTPGDLTLSLRLDDGKVVEHKIDPRTDSLPPLRNPNMRLDLNDLTALSYLDEPALLHNLKVRFTDFRLIYTYCGIVLVAINPYESLPVYGVDIINAYHSGDTRDMDPHIFAVAEEAYKQMDREGRNQSIIVSGDSGAGKTISAKYAMRYFATVSCSSRETSVEERVLASNPIMEAFGNAKTIRNDNSSRFGKYIEILFDGRRRIIGAHIRTYLLEKSRVVFQACGERNYHIFYQLCASSHLPEFQAFKLGCIDDFDCANQGQSSLITGVDEIKELCKTRRALSLLGISEREQMAIFQILAAILHLGNVQVNYQSDDQSRIPPGDVHLMAFCELTGVSCDDMAHWLCHAKLKTTTDTYVKCVSRSGAVSSRDALLKHVYTRLFGRIVDSINEALRSSVKQQSFIGVLDIYGFEIFHVNSFEQFCINYANEMLQQQFNLHVFKLGQVEYAKEGIPYTMIDFCDNQPVINLIESKLGILELLDEECKMPRGSDKTWAQKMYNTLLKKQAPFGKPKLSNTAFIIRHFGDKVEYQCDGFLEKNMDRVNQELINVLKRSKFDLLPKLLENDERASAAPHQHAAAVRTSCPGRHNVKTVGCQFRHSLHSLMDTLNATSPHYVRCIKPNDHKAAFVLDPLKVMQQLRACGILETIRISAAGFPYRSTYQEFFSRYHFLVQQRDLLPDTVQTCKNITRKLIKDQDMFRFGRTKLFFRAGQVAYLETLRSAKLCSDCVSIQKTVRGWLAHTKYQRMRKSAVTIQRCLRGYRARCYVTCLRRTRAAVVIQKNTRMWATKRRYQQWRAAAVTIQSFLRAHLARKQQHQVTHKQHRGWLERQRYRRAVKAAILLQRPLRCWRPKKELKKRKSKAHSVEHLQKLNVGMEKEIMQLQHKINQQHQEIGERSKLLRLVETFLTSERERDETQLEGQMEVNEEETQQESVEQITVGTVELDLEKLKRHELESENRKLKRDLNDLRKSLSSENAHLMPPTPGSRPYNTLLAQLNSSNEELEIRKEEVLLLHSHMIRQDAVKRRDSTLGESVKLDPEGPSLSNVDRTTPLGTLDEDCELWRVYEGLKEANRLLESQMQQQRRVHTEEYNKLLDEVERLRKEKEEEQNLLAQSLVLSEDAHIEGHLKHEITRLTRENLELLKQRETQDEAIRKLKEQLEDYVKKVEAYEAAAQPRAIAANIPRKEHEFQGLLEYRVADVSRLLKKVVTDLKPCGAADAFIPGLPAYILFMCVRYADCVNDDQRVSALLNSAISSIKGVVKRRGNEFEALSFWLANASRLRHCLKQYSGDKAVRKHNTAKQNQQSLAHFELSEYQEVLGDLINQIYHQLIKCSEAILQPIIVRSILNPETTQAVLESKPMGRRKSSIGLLEEEAITVEVLLQHLDHFHTTMNRHGVDNDLIKQVVRQLYYIIGTVSFNHLLLRKGMCSWSTGLQIRYNTWQLQDWLIDRELADCGAKETLEPLKQAALLLHVNKKTEADAASIGSLCTAISPTQIVKILSLYTPVTEFEERVSPAFITTVENILRHRVDSFTLLMDPRKIFTLDLVFTPSTVALETIQIPASLNLDFLTRI